MVASYELNGQLRLAYAAEPIEHKDLLSYVLHLWQECSSEFCHLGWSVHKRLDSGNAFETEVCLILSNGYKEFA